MQLWGNTTHPYEPFNLSSMSADIITSIIIGAIAISSSLIIFFRRKAEVNSLVETIDKQKVAFDRMRIDHEKVVNGLSRDLEKLEKEKENRAAEGELPEGDPKGARSILDNKQAQADKAEIERLTQAQEKYKQEVKEVREQQQRERLQHITRLENVLKAKQDLELQLKQQEQEIENLLAQADEAPQLLETASLALAAQKDAEELNALLADLREENQDLQQQLVLQTEKIEQLSQTIVSQKEITENWQENFEKLKLEKDTHLIQVEQYERQRLDLEEQIHQRDQEIQQLKSAPVIENGEGDAKLLGEVKNLHAEKLALNQQYEKARLEIEQLNQRVADLKQEKVNVEKKVTSKVSASFSEKEQWFKIKEEFEDQVESLALRLKAEENENKSLQEDRELLIHQHELSLQEWEQKNFLLHEDLRFAQQTINGWTEKYKNLTLNLEETDNKLQSAHLKNKEIYQRMRGIIEETEESIRRWETKYLSLKEKNKLILFDLDKVQKLQASLQEEKQLLMINLEGLESAKEMVSVQWKERYEKLLTQFEELEKKRKTIEEENQAMVRQMEISNMTTNSSIQQWRTKYDTLMEKYQVLERQMEEANIQSKVAELQIANLKRMVEVKGYHEERDSKPVKVEMLGVFSQANGNETTQELSIPEIAFTPEAHAEPIPDAITPQKEEKEVEEDYIPEIDPEAHILAESHFSIEEVDIASSELGASTIYPSAMPQEETVPNEAFEKLDPVQEELSEARVIDLLNANGKEDIRVEEPEIASSQDHIEAPDLVEKNRPYIDPGNKTAPETGIKRPTIEQLEAPANGETKRSDWDQTEESIPEAPEGKIADEKVGKEHTSTVATPLPFESPKEPQTYSNGNGHSSKDDPESENGLDIELGPFVMS